MGEIDFAYREALRFCKDEPWLMVEEHIDGRDHRLLFAGGAFVGCASSLAPSVTGDGRRSIRELIEAVNAGRTLNLYASGYLRLILTRDDLAIARRSPSVPGTVFFQTDEGIRPDADWPGPWFRDLIRGAMTDRSLDRILIVAELAMVETHGFPVDCLSKVIVGPGCRTRTIEAILAPLRCEVAFA